MANVWLSWIRLWAAWWEACDEASPAYIDFHNKMMAAKERRDEKIREEREKEREKEVPTWYDGEPEEEGQRQGF